ncbi:ribose ABC transporter ATP-binding protein RbsA [Anaeromicrobium sediminis]|uniref:Ribose ABC transporter ATP-binding protein RbsA n=1 Tax=Anaeromicrobium sediminis TaxID=1478221 RepID=A0A267MLN0_9FIRM|nr:ribose ABC transporter ATP-binding protein RbsA [Anaeromicrobium sediminis]PAB60501.1 ribose ABC transporter ATP-binding protein RbsA [Anaeromicrobium sediminis]
MKKILTMKNIIKEFPGVRALSGVDFNIYEGEVMALLGENGAGKSTLMKILTGVYEKTSGQIFLEGKEVNFSNTRDSQEANIGIIHQELNLIPELSVAENMFLGREPVNKFKRIDWKTLKEESQKLLDTLNVNIKPDDLVSTLSIGKQQMIEIGKALSLDAKIIIMDEPTDALTDKETETLFKVIRSLKAQGKSIVYISHRLEEIFEICDRVTILRDGKFIDEKEIEHIDQNEMIEKMVGRKISEQFPSVKVDRGPLSLELENVSNKYIKGINFKLHKGEIVGISGLMGAGRTELAKTIYGAYEISSGKILLEGKELNIKSPEEAINYGIAYVSEDRKKDGLILDLSVKENMSISSLKNHYSMLSKINKNKESEEVNYYVKSMNIKTPNADTIIKNLSGGNQQKVCISKNLMCSPKILILDEPTRGIDVGAKKEIYDLINKLKKEGLSIIMISSEIPEILGLSDRILVMHEGRITKELKREEATQERIMTYAVGIEEDR